MAVYNGREVVINHLTQSSEGHFSIESPEIGHQRVPVSEVQLTEQEKNDLAKKYNLDFPFNVVKQHKNFKTLRDQHGLPATNEPPKKAL